LLNLVADADESEFSYLENFRCPEMCNALPALVAQIAGEEATKLPPTLARLALGHPRAAKALLGALVALLPKVNRSDAGEAAGVLTEGLVALCSSDYPNYSSASFAEALSRIAPRLSFPDAAATLDCLVSLLAYPHITNRAYLGSLLRPLPSLSAEITGADAAQYIRVVLDLIEDPQEVDPQRRLCGVKAWAALVQHSKATEAARVGRRTATVLTTILDPLRTNTGLAHAPLVSELASLAAQMQPQDAAPTARALVQALESPWSLSHADLRVLAKALASVAASLRLPHGTTLFALDLILQASARGRLLDIWGRGINRDTDYEACRLVAELCKHLDFTDLAEALKWPLCVADLERVVLWELESQTQRRFDDGLRAFIAQAESLGVRTVDAPAKRPRARDVISELESLVNVPVHSP
jgi:hypothetical protein